MFQFNLYHDMIVMLLQVLFIIIFMKNHSFIKFHLLINYLQKLFIIMVYKIMIITNHLINLIIILFIVIMILQLQQFIIKNYYHLKKIYLGHLFIHNIDFNNFLLCY